MPKLILRCFCEIAGVDYGPGDKIEVDDDNASRMIRRGMAKPAPKVSPKKKAKPASSEE